VTQKENELLDKSKFYEHVPKPYAEEVGEITPLAIKTLSTILPDGEQNED